MPYDEVSHSLILNGREYQCSESSPSVPEERYGYFLCGNTIHVDVDRFPSDVALINPRSFYSRGRNSTAQVRELVANEPPYLLTYATRVIQGRFWIDRVFLRFKNMSLSQSITTRDCTKKYDEYRFEYRGDDDSTATFVFRFIQNMRRVVRVDGALNGIYYTYRDAFKHSDDIEAMGVRNGEIDFHFEDPWQSHGSYEVLNSKQILYKSQNGGSIVYTLDPTAKLW